MAKKKKSARTKKDARGYGQSQAQAANNKPTATTTAAPAISSQTQDGLKELLGQLEHTTQLTTSSTATATATATISDPRFVSKFTSIVDRLQNDLGFSEAVVNRVVPALAFDISLDTALDWLCLHLSTLELPALFTDGRIRNTLSTTTTADSLTVLKLEAPPPNNDPATSEGHPNQLKLLLSSSATDETVGPTQQERQQARKEQDEAAQRKAWLLQQYAYEEQDDEGEHGGEGKGQDEDEDDTEITQQRLVVENGDKVPAKPLSPSEPPPPRNDDATTADQKEEEKEAEEVTRSQSPEEDYLQQQESELAEMDADANSDANNYMRTKQEIKQLKIQVKKKRQQVIGLRKGVQRQKVKEAKEARAASAEEEIEEATNINPSEDAGKPEEAIMQDAAMEEDDNMGGGSLFGMFDEEATETTASASTLVTSADSSAPTSSFTRLDFTIPKNWTGTTPQKTLNEICRKQKFPKPKYTKLPHHAGYILSCTLKKKRPAQQWQAKTDDFVKGSSLQDYMALHTLYAIDSTVPLYRIFPPAFRDLWLSWRQEVAQAKEQVAQEEDTAKRQRVEYLLSLIPKKTTTTTSQSRTTESNLLEEFNEGKSIVVHENWDDEDTDDLPNINATTTAKPQQSALASKLQGAFVRRQSTAAYQKMLQIRSALPMTSFRDHVLRTVQTHPVTILCAETGAGKTTQCPQYLLEQALLNGHGDKVQILCTQPRRVAATSVAERVADELCDPLGKLVGYQIRMEAKRSAQTRLLFCTTGVVLRRLQDDRMLTGVTHVIVDEVHERQQQTDVLLVALRQLLGTTRPDLKVILMSATMDSELFCSFFQGAPLVSVPGRTFPVSNYYLEDLMDATDHIVEEGSRYALRENRYAEKASLWVTTRGGEKRKEVVDMASQTDVGEVSDLYPGYKMATRRSLDRVNEQVINYDLIEDVLNLILLQPENNDVLLAPDGADLSTGSVLVFLPGLGEIRSMTERLEASRSLGNANRFEIVPMHSTLSSTDQRRAFVPARAGCRKIILSTNIAETSVTIPDVVCVVDTGRVREVRRNKRTSTSILVTDWCSKASAKQRAGRAGRVQPGLCLKLYSSRIATNVMQAASEPELRRVPLEEICLSILASGFATSCMDFLCQAPQPPSEDSVQAATKVLHEVGAISVVETSTTKRKQMERLTPLGQHLARLPVDVRLGKMLIYGALFRCVDKVLTIAAALSSQSPFSTFVKDANVAKAKQRAFADPDSDFMTLCNVWEAYCTAAATSTSAGRKFCHANYLNYTALREIGDARRQFLDLLCSIGFLDRRSVIANNSKVDSKALISSRFNENAHHPELVHAVICAGLYPNVAHLQQPTSGDYAMFHNKDERLYFHNSSVNSKKKRFAADSSWVVFHEKFGTPHRVSVSTTGFVHPFALLLLGGSVVVKHTERTVVVDDWIEISMAAQIGVILRELRKSVDALLSKMIAANGNETDSVGAKSMIQGIVNLLTS